MFKEENAILNIAYIPGLAPFAMLYFILKRGFTINRLLGLILLTALALTLIPIFLLIFDKLDYIMEWRFRREAVLMAFFFPHVFASLMVTPSLKKYFKLSLTKEIVEKALKDNYGALSVNRVDGYIPGLPHQKFYFIDVGLNFERAQDMMVKIAKDLNFCKENYEQIKDNNGTELYHANKFANSWAIRLEFNSELYHLVFFWLKVQDLPVSLEYFYEEAGSGLPPIV